MATRSEFGFISGTLGRKMGLKVESRKSDAGKRTCRWVSQARRIINVELRVQSGSIVRGVYRIVREASAGS